MYSLESSSRRKSTDKWFSFSSHFFHHFSPFNCCLSVVLQLDFACVYEPVTKGRDLKWDTLPQNQTPSKLFSVLPLESGMFQVTISIIKKWF